MNCDWQIVQTRADGSVLVTFTVGGQSISHWFPAGYFTQER